MYAYIYLYILMHNYACASCMASMYIYIHGGLTVY